MQHELKVGDVVAFIYDRASYEHTVAERRPDGAIKLETREPYYFSFPEKDFRLIRRPVSADSPLIVGWYGRLRDGRRTGSLSKTINGVFQFASKVGFPMTWKKNGLYCCAEQTHACDIIAIEPPEDGEPLPKIPDRELAYQAVMDRSEKIGEECATEDLARIFKNCVSIKNAPSPAMPTWYNTARKQLGWPKWNKNDRDRQLYLSRLHAAIEEHRAKREVGKEVAAEALLDEARKRIAELEAEREQAKKWILAAPIRPAVDFTFDVSPAPESAES